MIALILDLVPVEDAPGQGVTTLLVSPLDTRQRGELEARGVIGDAHWVTRL